MKVKTQRRFSLSKKAKIGVAVGSAVILGFTALIVVGKLKDKSNFYTKLNEFASVERCNFRYVLNVRSTEATDKTFSAEELEDALNDTAFTNSDEENKGYEYNDTTGDGYKAPVGDQTGNLYQEHIQTDWTTQDGSKLVDWEYPNYELTVEGTVESVNPLKATIQLTMATNYVDAPFMNVTLIDDKCYFDVMTLRSWLNDAGDSSLVQLGKSIPDGVIYVVVSEDDLSFATGFAEEDEIKYSGATNTYNFYKRFIELERLCVGVVQNGLKDAGLSKDDTRYRLSITGENSVKLLSSIKSAFNNIGSYYNSYVSNISKAGLADEKQVTQMMNEKDNFLTSVHPVWTSLNMLTSQDVNDLGLVVIGKARDYKSNGVAYKEVNLGASYKWEGIEYIISLYGCKSSLKEDDVVSVPKESVTEVGAVDVDFSSMQDYLLSYFRFAPEYNKYPLGSTWDTFELTKLKAFVELVNAENEREGFSIKRVNMYNIQSYLDTYSSMSEIEANSNPATKFNYDLVAKYNMTENDEQNVEIQEEEKPKVRGVDIISSQDEVDYTLTNAHMPNDKCIVVDIEAMLNPEVVSSDAEVIKSFDVTQFYLTDDDGNVYPCNHKDFIRDANIGVSSSEVVQLIGVSQTQSTNKLYFIVDGYKNYSLHYEEMSFGRLIKIS